MEVARHRFEAWKGAAARAGARTTLEFAKGWYPDLDLAHLATFRLEAEPELAAARGDLIKRTASLADYTDTTVSIPQLDEKGHVVPPDNFGLDLAAPEELHEDIASSDDGEDKGDSDEEASSQEGEPSARDQPDQASTSGPSGTAPSAAGSD